MPSSSLTPTAFVGKQEIPFIIFTDRSTNIKGLLITNIYLDLLIKIIVFPLIIKSDTNFVICVKKTLRYRFVFPWFYFQI